MKKLSLYLDIFYCSISFPCQLRGDIYNSMLKVEY